MQEEKRIIINTLAAQRWSATVTLVRSGHEELRVQLHGVMLRRTKDEVLDLPPKIRNWMPVSVQVNDCWVLCGLCLSASSVQESVQPAR